MKQVVLDTSFILSCVKKKIDFFEKIKLEGFQIFIPKQTIKELKGLGSKLELKIVEKNSGNFEIKNYLGKDADSAIVKMSEENPELIVATLDKELAKKIKNRKMIIRGEKKIEVI